MYISFFAKIIELQNDQIVIKVRFIRKIIIACIMFAIILLYLGMSFDLIFSPIYSHPIIYFGTIFIFVLLFIFVQLDLWFFKKTLMNLFQAQGTPKITFLKNGIIELKRTTFSSKKGDF